jgi:uncharacterized protein YjeT (DUF2065 family)
MERTRRSLYYVVVYLMSGGIGFLFAPQLSLQLFFSTGQYDDSMLRMLGIMLFTLAIMVLQIARHRVEILYPTTLAVRSMILVVMAILYLRAGDPMYLILCFIVALCYFNTLFSFLLDNRLMRSEQLMGAIRQVWPLSLATVRRMTQRK